MQPGGSGWSGSGGERVRRFGPVHAPRSPREPVGLAEGVGGEPDDREPHLGALEPGGVVPARLAGAPARFVAAHLHARLHAGATSESALLLSRKGSRLTQRTLNRLALPPLTEIGARTVNTPQMRIATAAQRARAHGITITNLKRGQLS